MLSALGKRDAELEADPNATIFGQPERNAVRRQAVKVWVESLLTGAALAGLVWVAVLVVR